VNELAQGIRARLRDAADPALAPGQQAYMKSAMPFLGVTVPEVRRIATAAARGRSAAETRAAAAELWDAATHREERYAAMMLLAPSTAAGDLEALPLIERFVREGAWWDFTDDLAHRLGELLDAHPQPLASRMRAWSTDADLWIRRAAILCQLQHAARTDLELLADVVDANAGDPEFFIRKAIGWALRDLARTRPEWVAGFVRGRELSPLSIREALKHIPSA